MHPPTWDRQGHPPQRTPGQSLSSTVRKMKDEKFYSGEKLQKYSSVTLGWRLGLYRQCPPRRHQGSMDLGQEELGLIWTRSLEKEKKSWGWEWSQVRSWRKGWGTIRKGAGT